MAAKIDVSKSDPVGTPEPLFRLGWTLGTFMYDLMPDGRFVILEPVDDDTTQEPPEMRLRITQNWYEEFRDLE